MNSVLEVWKPVKGYEGRYEVSNCGNVKSVARGSILKASNHPRGYKMIGLPGKNSALIHRLVAESFLTNATLPKHVVVKHLNGDLSDNRSFNLMCEAHAERKPRYIPLVPRKPRQSIEAVLASRRLLPIPDCDGYFAGDDGTIWSSFKNGRNSNKCETIRQINGAANVRSGHLQGKISGVFCKFHQLIARTFIGRLPPSMEVRHINGNPADNRAANLAYGTRKENVRDGVLHGTVNPKWMPLIFRKEVES